MSAKRLIAMVSMGALTVAGTLAFTASAASAAPSNCTLTYGSNWAQSICTSGTGEHQVSMLQKHFMPGIGYIACAGNWAAVGQVSYTACANHTIVNVWINTRG